MIVLRLADGSLLVLLPDGQAVRVDRGGSVTAIDVAAERRETMR